MTGKNIYKHNYICIYITFYVYQQRNVYFNDFFILTSLLETPKKSQNFLILMCQFFSRQDFATKFNQRKIL